jgi:hypothetical protein
MLDPIFRGQASRLEWPILTHISDERASPMTKILMTVETGTSELSAKPNDNAAPTSSMRLSKVLSSGEKSKRRNG